MEWKNHIEGIVTEQSLELKADAFSCKACEAKGIESFLSRGIQELPHGMEQLHNLNRLDLTYTSIEVFPDGLLAAFILMDELFIVDCGFFMKIKGSKIHQRQGKY